MTINSERKTTARKPRAPKPATTKPTPAEPKLAQDAQVHDPRSAADQQSQAAGGDVAKPEGAEAAPSGGAAAPSTAGGPPPAAEFSPADFDGAAIFVSGPKKGRWRSGIYFGPEPTELVASDWEHQLADGERLYAVLTDPRLKCVLRLADGTELPMPAEVLERMRAMLDTAAEGE